jgi:diacylglycerol kinase family enzyme
VRAVLIVNPFATRVNDEVVAAALASLRSAADVDVVRTERRGHATSLAAAATEDSACDAVVVLSGDGGFNEVVNGIARDIPVGFLPGGGTSVLPRALGLPADPVAAAAVVAEALASSRTRRISLGRVNDRRFTFSAGVGFDAEAVRRVERLRRSDGRRPGDVRFALELGRILMRRRARFEPALDVLGRGRAAFLFVGNGVPYTYGLGRALPIVPDAQFELGLDYLAPTAVRARDVPTLLRYAFTGRGQTSDARLLYAHDVNRIEVACERPLPLQADGEDLGDVTHVVFEAERDALSVLV